MKITEFLFGYDIRYPINCELRKKAILNEYPYIEYPKAYCTFTWPSRFRASNNEDPIYDPVKTNFRAPDPFDKDGKFIVQDEYSETYYYSGLWDNLGNMLLYYPPDKDVDTIAAFTFCYFDTPTIMANDINSYDRVNIFQSSMWRHYYEYQKDSFVPKSLNKNQWRFVGYDVSNGFGTLMYSKKAIEGMGVKSKRNKFGLLNDIRVAIKECSILNEKEPKHDAWLVIAIYDAIDWNKFDFMYA